MNTKQGPNRFLRAVCSKRSNARSRYIGTLNQRKFLESSGDLRGAMRPIRTFKAGIIAPLPPSSLSPAYFFPDLIAAIGRINRLVKIARDGSSIGRGSQKMARSYNQKMERWMKKEKESMSLEWKSEEKKRKKLSRRIKVRESAY